MYSDQTIEELKNKLFKLVRRKIELLTFNDLKFEFQGIELTDNSTLLSDI